MAFLCMSFFIIVLLNKKYILKNKVIKLNQVDDMIIYLVG